MPALLSVSQLRVTRGGVHVLNGLDWQTQPKQHWAILGANGSGKTSLLSCLCGLLSPTDGQMQLLGTTFGEANMQPARRQIALVGSALRQMVQDEETAMEVAISGLHGQINYWGIPTKAEQKTVATLAEQTGCAALLHRPWAVLSQGERQKVLITRALLSKPKVLILDEPCAGLDPAAREHFLASIAALLTAATPQIIFVTHHVEEILPGITHALGIKQGRTHFSGPKAEVLTSPNLSQLFDAPLKLRTSKGRYILSIQGQ